MNQEDELTGGITWQSEGAVAPPASLQTKKTAICFLDRAQNLSHFVVFTQ